MKEQKNRGGIIMLQRKKYQPDFWDSIIPQEALELNEELSTIDGILDDERFFMPYLEKFSKNMGRPSTPISVYLRMMYLKFRYNLGYEMLIREVEDSFKWRKFCHLSFTDKVPDSTTLIKLTKRFGEDTLQQINGLLVQKLKESKLIRGKKLRADTTVIESNIHYPTDAGILADGIRVLTRTAKKIKAAGYGIRVGFINHTRKVKRVLTTIGKFLRKRDKRSSDAIKKQVHRLVKVTDEVVRRSIALRNAFRRKLRPGLESHKRPFHIFKEQIRLVKQVVQQTKEVLSGNRHIRSRVVSIFDPGARPIQKGKISKPTEFGHSVVLSSVDKGIISNYQVVEANPKEAKFVRKLLRKHRTLFGEPPREFAADRGFSSKRDERYLMRQGVEHVSLPARGKKSLDRKMFERQFWFRRLQRFRAGKEALISLLKRKFCLRRSLMRGTLGTSIWVGWCMITYNLWQTVRIKPP